MAETPSVQELIGAPELKLKAIESFKSWVTTQNDIADLVDGLDAIAENGLSSAGNLDSMRAAKMNLSKAYSECFEDILRYLLYVDEGVFDQLKLELWESIEGIEGPKEMARLKDSFDKLDEAIVEALRQIARNQVLSSGGYRALKGSESEQNQQIADSQKLKFEAVLSGLLATFKEKLARIFY